MLLIRFSNQPTGNNTMGPLTILLDAPMLAFYWHPTYECYVIDRGSHIELCGF